MKEPLYDLNCFQVGQVVDIDDIEDLQGIKIDRISDCGVTISGNGHYETVVSGKSPARLSTKSYSDLNPTARAAITAPATLTFTIRQLAEHNSTDITQATIWVRENCDEAGFAEKAEGQRGRAAKLFKVKPVQV